MDRRSYLGVVLGLLTAGCSARSRRSGTPQSVTDAAETESETRTDTRQTTTPPATDQPGTGPEATLQTIEIGERAAVTNPDDNQPHSLVIWNTATTRRRINVEIVARPAETDVVRTVLGDTFRVPADTAVRIELLEPATYTVEVSVPATGDRRQYTISQSAFDCNYHSHEFAIDANGEIDVTETSTLLGCSPPETYAGATPSNQ